MTVQNVTAIVDKDQAVCFIMPLNRTLVKPPRNFWDMMLKLKACSHILQSSVATTVFHGMQNFEANRGIAHFRKISMFLQNFAKFGIGRGYRGQIWHILVGLRRPFCMYALCVISP